LFFGLKEALDIIAEEGLENVFARHARHAEATRRAVRAWGLDTVCAEPSEYSQSVTAVVVPEGRSADGLRKLTIDMAVDPDHPLREKAEEGLAALAWDMQHDPAMRAKVEGWKNEVIANKAVTDWVGGLWETSRAGLLKAARDPDAAMAGKFGEALRQLGETLQQDARLNKAINQFSRRAVVGMVASYGSGIVTLVSETVRGSVTGRAAFGVQETTFRGSWFRGPCSGFGFPVPSSTARSPGSSPGFSGRKWPRRPLTERRRRSWRLRPWSSCPTRCGSTRDRGSETAEAYGSRLRA
jgi:hypothetical protein